MKSETNRIATVVQHSSSPVALNLFHRARRSSNSLTRTACGVFRIQQLDILFWSENPDIDGKTTSPPDLLVLVFQTRIVILLGWRLELMLGPLVSGRVARIHAEKHLGTLMIEEAWVSEIHRHAPSSIATISLFPPRKT